MVQRVEAVVALLDIELAGLFSVPKPGLFSSSVLTLFIQVFVYLQADHRRWEPWLVT